MQAIARVNRVFKDKPGGLVVDYLSVAQELKQALATYTESGGYGKAAVPQEEAVEAMLDQYVRAARSSMASIGPTGPREHRPHLRSGELEEARHLDPVR